MSNELKERETELVEAYGKGRNNLVDYRHILLSCGKDEVLPAPFHFKWSDDLLHKSGHCAKQGFRESAKSQYVLRAYPLYCLTFPDQKRDYLVIIKNNATLAKNKLKEIESEYVSNPAISINLVKINEKSGEVFDVDVKDSEGNIVNVRIEAYGKGASVRGLVNKDRRPKVVIVDDPQDVEDAKSDTVQNTDWEWFLSDIMFLGQNTRIFLIGNNLGDKCIIERVFANPEELGFRIERTPTLTQEGKSAWASKYTVEEIDKQRENFRRLGKIDIWMREKMCVAVSEESRSFHKEDFRYYPNSEMQRIALAGNIALTLDPASSMSPESCLRAMVIKATNEENYWHILDCPYGRWNSDELIDVLFQKVIAWKIQKVYIEKGMYKQVIEPFIHKEMAKRNQFFDILPIEHAKQGSKLERVKMLGSRFKAHTIWFPYNADWLAELVNELLGVTKDGFKSLYTDLIDALAMHEQIDDAPLNAVDAGNLPRSVSMHTPLYDMPIGSVPGVMVHSPMETFI